MHSDIFDPMVYTDKRDHIVDFLFWSASHFCLQIYNFYPE